MRALLKNVLFPKVPPRTRLRLSEIVEHLPDALRYGKAYRDTLSLLRKSDNWDEQALVKYQQERLELLIEHAYENVPYYREVFEERGLTPKDIQSVNDIRKLPYLTKKIVRQRKADLLASNYSSFDREEARTSGSTGSPLSFFMDLTTRPFERALAWRHLQWLGYRDGDPIAYFKVAPFAAADRWHAHYRTKNQLRISFGVVNDERMRQIVTKLKELKPAFISAWPSSLYLLARWMKRVGETIPAPRFLVTGSENLYPHVRTFIEEVLNTKIADHYGQEEAVAVAMQCPLVQGYHMQGEMSIIELQPFRRGLAEIVGTCLQNFAMPFIRYQTGDLAEPADGPCPCGRNQPILKSILGRDDDFIVTPERNLVSPLMLNLLFHRRDDIREGQIVQEDFDFIRVKLVAWDRISSETKESLAKDLQRVLESSKLNIVVEEVSEIPRTAGLKRPFVVSHLGKEDQL
jgi:phenylacetate-CoA ligase